MSSESTGYEAPTDDSYGYCSVLGLVSELAPLLTFDDVIGSDAIVVECDVDVILLSMASLARTVDEIAVCTRTDVLLELSSDSD